MTEENVKDRELPEDEAAAEKEYFDYLRKIIKQARKLFTRQQRYMTDNNDTANALLLFLKEYPDLFANGFGITERDMIKWALGENIKHTQLLIDKITELETELGLPLEYDY